MLANTVVRDFDLSPVELFVEESDRVLVELEPVDDILDLRKVETSSRSPCSISSATSGARSRMRSNPSTRSPYRGSGLEPARTNTLPEA